MNKQIIIEQLLQLFPPDWNPNDENIIEVEIEEKPLDDTKRDNR